VRPAPTELAPGRRVLLATSAGALLLLSVVKSVAGAEPPSPAPAPASSAGEADPKTELARRHFRNGIKLFNDNNFQGALAEFEAAFELKPGAGSLQNIALSLKALFRYAEAADKLELLLARHAGELSEQERRDVKSAIDELNQLVGSIVVKTTPPDARVSVDGRRYTPDERAAGIRLDVGEHTVVADASGYDQMAQVIRIPGGKTRVPIDLALKPNAGFINVSASDPDAAIAVDGQARAFQRWRGPVTPGRHYVQVYRQGYPTFERAVHVELGYTVDVVAELGAPLSPDEALKQKAAPGKPAPKPQQRGWYALAALGVSGIDEAPEDLNIDKAKQTAGGSFGVRAGYRLWTPVAVEALLEGAKHEFQGACDEAASTVPCDQPGAVIRSYSLDSFRIGGNLRLMSSAERLRFVSTLGVGTVRHHLQFDEPSAGSSLDCQGNDCQGFDPYFLAELGAQLNLGHILLELDALLFVDGVRSVRGSLGNGESKAVFGENTGGLRMIGLGLKGGWGEWKP